MTLKYIVSFVSSIVLFQATTSLCLAELHADVEVGPAYPTSPVIAEPTLLDAIIWHESSNDPMSFGDRKLPQHAYGILQIRKCLTDDVNRIYGTHFHAEDCMGNREVSIEIFMLYVKKYATTEHLGHRVTMEDIARMWNGGPSGYRWHSTEKYWVDIGKAYQYLVRTGIRPTKNITIKTPSLAAR